LNYTGNIKTVAKSYDSNNLIGIDKSARLDLPELFVQIALVREKFFVRPCENDSPLLHHD